MTLTASRPLTSRSVPEFIRDLRWADVPPAVAERVAWLMVDAAVAAELGCRVDAAAIIGDLAAECFGGNQATSLLDGRRLSAPGAALVNGTILNAVDIDDGHSLAKGHPGAVVIAAALAVAETTDADMEEFLTATLIGYEVAVRAALALHARSAVFHSSGTWGAVGAAAAAGRLLGLDTRQISWALGHAEYTAPVDLIMRGVASPSMAKDAMGWAAHVGVTAAMLAQRGFTGHASEYEESVTTSDLGQRWQVMEVYVKPYPCCRWAHPALDATRLVLDELGDDLGPNTIRRIEIRTFAAAAALNSAVPDSSEGAQFNLRWPVASMLAAGTFTMDSITTALTHPTARQLHELVEVVVDDELSAAFPAVRGSRVSVELTDGRRSTHRVERARGEADDPNWSEVIKDKAIEYLGAGDDDFPLRVTPPRSRLGHRPFLEVKSVLRHPLKRQIQGAS